MELRVRVRVRVRGRTDQADAGEERPCEVDEGEGLNVEDGVES